jgi:multicomponent Na+:H+ antiporter subunit F
VANTIFVVAGAVALIATALAFVRILLGPTIPDRAVGLDGMTIIAISLIAFLAHFSNRLIYLDVALVYAVVSFLGVVALGRYVERGL